ncbi:hypothetical protein DFQ28_007844 [Apophysomyces sp. BC1034]|nr:hypothetical protein DFQ28_007844 [Apophysomyces sp. BC1034]
MTLHSSPVKLALVAGEPSGDLLAASLLDGLAARLPAGTPYYGIGGPRMAAHGFDAHWPMDKLSVRGYVEALRHIPEILRIRGELKRQLLAEPPSAFIGVDAPDFNFSLEQALRHAGIPTIHFVCPSIWAWRGARIKKIVKAVDHMLCVFPFETAILDNVGVASTYVGHPLADAIALQPDVRGARRASGLPDDGPVIAVLPGSRRCEIELIGPTFFAAMDLMQKREPSLRFVVPAPNAAIRALLQPLADGYPALAVTLTEGNAQTAMTAADAVLVKSGTVTLEAALLKKPMVISYKVPWLTGQIMRRQGYLPYVGLPNILAGRFIVPEILQHFATPEALADAMLLQLNDDANRRTLVDLFTDMHHRLRCNTAERAAEVVVDVGTPMSAGRTRVLRRQAAPATVQRGLDFDDPSELLCGVDEAGRGPLAGPVLAAAVILDPAAPRIRGLDDSKALSAATREKLFDRIIERSLAYCVASASVDEIDTLNILHATMLAMQRAVLGLALTPALVKIDGNRCPVLPMRSEAVIGGDALVPSISAASILAKVTRDRMMHALHAQFPHYGFDAHVGYGTPQHLVALRAHGPCVHHRRSFAPVREAYAALGTVPAAGSIR